VLVLDQPQSEHVEVEVDGPLRVACDHRDVVQLRRAQPQRIGAASALHY
jgi:hypothetical protein